MCGYVGWLFGWLFGWSRWKTHEIEIIQKLEIEINGAEKRLFLHLIELWGYNT